MSIEIANQFRRNKNKMKKLLFAAMLTSGVLFAGESATVIQNGNVNTLSDDFQIKIDRTSPPEANHLAFDKPDSLVMLRMPKQERSLSIVVDVVPAAFPKKGIAAIATRQGFNNMLGIDTKGHFIFTIWGADKKTMCAVRSPKKAECGRKYRLAGIINSKKDSAEIILLVDGKEVGHTALKTAPYPYSRDLYIGAATVNGHMAFHGAIENFFLSYSALSAEDVAQLK